MIEKEEGIWLRKRNIAENHVGLHELRVPLTDAIPGGTKPVNK
jgi:hypothetical protein